MWIDGKGNFKRFEEANLKEFSNIISNKDNKISNIGLNPIKCLELLKKYPSKIRINGRIYNDSEYLIDEIMVFGYKNNLKEVEKDIIKLIGVPKLFNNEGDYRVNKHLYIYYKPGVKATGNKIYC